MVIKKLEIYLADYAGFCGGVKRACKLAFAAADDGVYCLGDIVHNEVVINDLKEKKVKTIDNTQVYNSKVIIRSHGVPKEDLEKLRYNNNEIIDCVCPKVKKIYNIVEIYYKKGYNIIIVGDENHPEVKGINSYCNNEAIIFNKEEDLKVPVGKTIVVAQSTSNEKVFDYLTNLIKNISKSEILVYNTICDATFNRQNSIRKLAKIVDAVIVLGGKKSSNTKKLAEVAKESCKNVFLIQSIKDIDINILKKFNKIGITAGASTPDKVIKEAVSSMENFDKGEMMEAIDNSFKRIKKGEIVTGEVLYVTDNEVMVNLGYRSDGIISKEELSKNTDAKPSDLYKQGDEIEVFVLKMDDGDGNVVLSARRVEDMKVWDEIEKSYNNHEIVTAKVINQVKGGLTASLDGISAFIPASHVTVKFQRDLSKFVGDDFQCEIIDFDKRKRRIVLSRKNVLMRELEEKRSQIFESLHIGDVIEGTVQRLTNFGAFVDIGGIDGLVHISELSWNRVKHPSEVVSAGDKVKVQVLSLDEEKDRIALGLKQTTEKPWDKFINAVKVGDVVKGKVVNILDFGAFVRLEEGVDGLLHVSQICREHIEKPQDRLEIGQEVEVKVIEIDQENKKISLSIKALLEPIEDDEKKEKSEKPKVKKERPRRPKENRVKKQIQEPKEDEFNTTIGDLLGFSFGDSSFDVVANEEEKKEETSDVEETTESEESTTNESEQVEIKEEDNNSEE